MIRVHRDHPDLKHLWVYLGDGRARSRCGMVCPLSQLAHNALATHWCRTCAAAVQAAGRAAVEWERLPPTSPPTPEKG